MWVLRRASTQLRNQGLSSSAVRILDVNSEIGSGFPDNYDLITIRPQGKLFSEELSFTRSYATSSYSSKLHAGIRTFSSEAGDKNTGGDDDDLEDSFSESDVSENEDLHGDLENVGSERKSYIAADTSPMTETLLAAPLHSVSKIMDKWVEEGNEVTPEEAMLSISYLWKHRFFGRALQLSEWLEATKKIDFDERLYASHVDLIARAHGLSKAEDYLKSIPESFKDELVYRALLTNYVSALNIKKSEEVFNKMRDLGLPLTSSSCNQLIRLYKRIDRKKIADVLSLMEKENVEPTCYTYQLLVDAKGTAKDIIGMEKVVQTMKSKGVEPDPSIQTSLVRHYIASGLKDKAEAVLKEIEGGDLEKNRWVFRMLLPIYASLGKEQEVLRIWKICETEARLSECVAAIEAWGQLGNIENAESAFEKLLQKVRQPSAKHYTPLLYIYANHKMLSKGEDLMRRMMELGCRVGPLTWDGLVALYVAAGELEKANAMLKKARNWKYNFKPLFKTFFMLLNQYAKRGDVLNAEEIFHKMREAGYVSRLPTYESLLRAYLNAKAPAYGFRERMKADNLFPNRAMVGLLGRVNGFRKPTAVDLLE